MTTSTLEQLLPRLLEDMEGSEGFWHGERGGITIYVIADEEHDRLRVMAPIGELRTPDSGFLTILLQANFDRALDARYALRRKEVWSVFMHPLSTVVPDDLGLYLDQVARLVQNTGRTYASTDLVFGVDDERLDEDEYDVEITDAEDDEDTEGAATDDSGDGEDDEEYSLEFLIDEEEIEDDDEDDDEDQGKGRRRASP